MAEKKKNIKPLIILGVVLVAALIGFLIYDEVKTANYRTPTIWNRAAVWVRPTTIKRKIQKRRAKQYARQILFVQTMA